MDVAALVLWILTATGGSVLLGRWLQGGGHRGRSHLPAALVFGHFGLAATGLVVWICYLASDENALAWIAFALLPVVALGGWMMFFRWLPASRRHQATVPAGEPGPSDVSGGGELAENRFPMPVVAGHGVFAVATVVTVLLAALEIGTS